MLKFAAILENFLTVSKEGKNTVTPWPRNLTITLVYPKRNKSILIQKDVLYKMLPEDLQ